MHDFYSGYNDFWAGKALDRDNSSDAYIHGWTKADEDMIDELDREHAEHERSK